MPPVSEAQRRWAFANRDKKGEEGKAAREFADADPGGKLPERRNKPEPLAIGGMVRRTEPGKTWIDRLPYGHDDLSFSQDSKMAIKPEMDIDDGITTGEQPPRVTAEHKRGGKIKSTKGPKPPNADDGWITAQKGEYVIRKDAVQKLGTKVLDQINRTGRLPPSGKNKPESLFNVKR